MTNENPVPTTFPEALAAIEADNAGPRPISEAIDRIVLKADVIRHIVTAESYVHVGDWAAAYIELMAAANLIEKMGVGP